MTNRRTVLGWMGATLGGSALPVLKQQSGEARARETGDCSLRPDHLRVEWRTAPLGIDTRRPRFSWTLAAVGSSARNLHQRACRVVVASSVANARSGHGDLWDSREKAHGKFSLSPDHDLELHPQTAYYWSLAVRDSNNRLSPWSEPQQFVTGIPDARDWRAAWIAAEADRTLATAPFPAINTQPPVAPQPLPLFRHDFEINAPIQQAIVCVSGLGQYELRLNGSRCGSGVLNPGWTDYCKTILYDTFDVTKALRNGTNTLGILLGNGMYNVEKYAGRYTKRVGSFGQPKFILQLRVRFTDGTEKLIVSNSSWQTRPGPIVLSHAYGGEDFDARREPAGWDQPAREPTSPQPADTWAPALEVGGPGGTLRAQNVPPVVVADTLTPIAMSQPRPGIRVFDLGENFSGWPQIVVRGTAGSQVKLVTGELLDVDGLVTQRSANARPGNEVSFTYTLAGRGEETWHPRFTYYGFRYVQAEATGGHVELISLEGHYLHADLPRVGTFECSNPLLVRIHHLINQALLSNTMSVLTDCPQREKLGWLEQTYLNADTVFYNEDAVTLYEKMLRDMQDSQLANGSEPEIAPEYVAFLNADGSDSVFRDSPEWGAALVLSPWATYRFCGDRRILDDGYASMQRYAHYLESRLQDGLLDFGLGDWYDVGPQPPGPAQLTRRQLTGTAVYCEVLLALTRIARILGYPEDAQRYSVESASAIHTFNTRLFNPITAQYDRGSMTANAMPLAIGLVPPAHHSAVLANLVANVRAHGNHVTAGDVGFHYVVRALMDNGRADVLYDILTRADAPSYGYQLAQGATALTEAWDANPSKSQNHFMLGHAETWLFGGLGGIRIDFDHPEGFPIRIAPQPPVGVTSVSVRYHSVLGEVVSSWNEAGGRLRLHIEIPPGASARVRIPGASHWLTVGSGRYDFEAQVP